MILDFHKSDTLMRTLLDIKYKAEIRHLSFFSISNVGISEMIHVYAILDLSEI